MLESAQRSRESGFELLRILAMLMIISFHIVVHTVEEQLGISGGGGIWQPGSISAAVSACVY